MFQHRRRGAFIKTFRRRKDARHLAWKTIRVIVAEVTQGRKASAFIDKKIKGR